MLNSFFSVCCERRVFYFEIDRVHLLTVLRVSLFSFVELKTKSVTAKAFSSFKGDSIKFHGTDGDEVQTLERTASINMGVCVCVCPALHMQNALHVKPPRFVRAEPPRVDNMFLDDVGRVSPTVLWFLPLMK